MGRNEAKLVYLKILERSQDPVALRLGIICSNQFPEEVKEKARTAATIEALQSLLHQQRQQVDMA